MPANEGVVFDTKVQHLLCLFGGIIRLCCLVPHACCNVSQLARLFGHIVLATRSFANSASTGSEKKEVGCGNDTEGEKYQ